MKHCGSQRRGYRSRYHGERQARIASGDGLSIKRVNIRSRGHAIECRINAEHPISLRSFSRDGRKVYSQSR